MEYEDFMGSDCPDIDESTLTSVSVSMTSEAKKRKKMVEDAKKLDKGFHKVKRREGRHQFNVEFYSTSYCPGFRIRNAITGMYEEGVTVGTRDEHLFFVVILATGETGQTPPHLYYDTPEQYERHFNCTVSDDTKERWRERNLKERYRRNMVSEREATRRGHVLVR
jgi:hypothetical protein